MQRIAYSAPDGSVSIVTPVEGARLAWSVTLAVDGIERIFEDWQVTTPRRLVAPATFEEISGEAGDGEGVEKTPEIWEDEVRKRFAHPVDWFLRRWPVEGAVAEWAESEADFVARVRAQAAPPGVESVLIDETSLPDRATRNGWRLVDGAIVVDDSALPRIAVSRLRLKLTLVERGKLATVEQAVAKAGAVAQLYWTEAADFESDHPLVGQIGAAIGLDAAGIRELFTAARDRDA